SQWFGCLVAGGAVRAATSCFGVPTSLSRTLTLEHKLASLSLEGCNSFLMALCQPPSLYPRRDMVLGVTSNPKSTHGLS
ncbi:hypothetical protein HAX54_044241, partial [Datura stramonium]|nr:hypothetical protein [Datura stramonium]